ncbi:MAG: hypothetical protein V1722_04005 [Candidatus Micrarchaeota archaeon]
MIIEPKSLEQMEAQLKAIPEAQRKVLVLVGRHPNEGTFNIAREHHKKWEAHGAVVIRIPAKWTPHKFWHDKARGKLPPGTSSFSVPSDNDVINFLAQSGFKVPVLNFHSSPYTFLNSSLFYVLKARKSHLSYHVAPWSAVYRYKGFQVARGMINNPNEVCVELNCRGAELNPKARAHVIAEKFSEPKNQLHQVQIGPRAVNNALITRKTLSLFEERHGAAFESILAHLAKTGLKPKPVTPRLSEPYEEL